MNIIAQMQTSDWVRILIPFITFILGLISATIIRYFTRKRSVVAWSVISEVSILTKEATTDINIPIQILVNNEPHDSLTAVKLRIGSASNEVIENVDCVISFNSTAKIFRVRSLQNLGEFRKQITLHRATGRLTISFRYLNPEHRTIDFEILFANYESGIINLDIAKPGTSLIRRDVSRWNVKLSFIQNIALSIAGIRYDPTVSPLSDIVVELRDLKKILVGDRGLLDENRILYHERDNTSTENTNPSPDDTTDSP